MKNKLAFAAEAEQVNKKNHIDRWSFNLESDLEYDSCITLNVFHLLNS